MSPIAVLSIDSSLMFTVVNSKNFSNSNVLTSSKIFKFPSLFLSALMSDSLGLEMVISVMEMDLVLPVIKSFNCLKPGPRYYDSYHSCLS